MSIIPKPASMEAYEGQFTLTPATRFSAGESLKKISQDFQCFLSRATGFVFNAGEWCDQHGVNLIKLAINESLNDINDEGYRLEIQPDHILLEARTPAGIFYGTRTLLQLLPVEIFRSAIVEGVVWNIPCGLIVDSPRFGWRGLMLDCCRHFMPKEFVKKYIDLLSLHKMNRFHWHLTDDQGWRIEIKRYPKLTQVGAYRPETVVGKTWETGEDVFDGTPHGGFYTQEDIKEVVNYAAERFVTVVPEIEMPGHAQAAIAAYPELGNTGEQIQVRSVWGISENVFNANNSTIEFMQNVLEEVLTLFPSTFIHVGGDECPKKQWRESEAMQKRIKELGLADEHELQSYFIRQMDHFLTTRGRRLIGWDEILEGGLAENATVMSWRGEKGGIAAAKSGHDVVMAPNTYTYLDYYQTEDIEHSPLRIGGFVPMEKVYGYEPIPAELSEEEGKRVLGAQGQLWAEYLPDPKHVEYQAYPRALALAEVVWVAADKKEYAEFLDRLNVALKRLDILDVNYYRG